MKRVLAAVVMFVLTVVSCSSDAAESPLDGTVVLGDSSDSDAEADSNDESSAPTGGSSAIQTIWPVPPFGSATVDPGFGAYSVVDDEFIYSENVTFEMTDTDRDSVVAFYQDTLASLGYEVGPPLELGESIALNVSMAGIDSITAVVQIGPKSPTDPTIIVHQERTEFKDQAEDDETPPDADSSSSGGASDG